MKDKKTKYKEAVSRNIESRFKGDPCIYQIDLHKVKSIVGVKQGDTSFDEIIKTKIKNIKNIKKDGSI